MASSLQTSFGVPRLTSRRNIFRAPRARAESSGGDEESVVDANLGVLKERIDMVRMKERLEWWCMKPRRSGGDHVGWKHDSIYYDSKMSRRDDRVVAESYEIAKLVVGTFGFTILSCTLCLLLVSFIVHLGFS